MHDTAPTASSATTAAPATATEQIPSIQVTRDLSSTEQADASSETIYPAPNLITRSLQAIVQEIERSADEDDSDSSMFIDDASSSTFSFTILDLFDFTNEHWTEAQMRSAVGSLEDELEVYEMLELDTSGEADLELDLDDTMENILRV